MWDLIVSVPDHCLSFYLVLLFFFNFGFFWDYKIQNLFENRILLNLV